MSLLKEITAVQVLFDIWSLPFRIVSHFLGFLCHLALITFLFPLHLLFLSLIFLVFTFFFQFSWDVPYFCFFSSFFLEWSTLIWSSQMQCYQKYSRTFCWRDKLFLRISWHSSRYEFLCRKKTGWKGHRCFSIEYTFWGFMQRKGDDTALSRYCGILRSVLRWYPLFCCSVQYIIWPFVFSFSYIQ